MAILGTIKTLINQCDKLKFYKALQFLQASNLNEVFSRVEVGKPLEIEIDGRSIFAVFQCYETKNIEEANIEGHKKYIDIQYLHSGIEQILVAPSSRMIKDADYDESNDIYFPKAADYSSIRLNAGMGCILYPEDLHAPGISIDAPARVEKVVIKVATE